MSDSSFSHKVSKTIRFNQSRLIAFIRQSKSLGIKIVRRLLVRVIALKCFFFTVFSQYLKNKLKYRKKRSIAKMILMISPIKIILSQIFGQLLLKFTALERHTLTRWAIEAPGSLLLHCIYYGQIHCFCSHLTPIYC